MQIQQFLHTASSPLPNLDAWDNPNVLVITFSAPEFRDDPTCFEHLRAHFPNAVIMGCSTSGEIHQDEVHDQSVSGICVRFDKTTLMHHTIALADHDSTRTAAQALGRQFETNNLKAVFVLSDGLQVNGSQLIAGLNSVLPEDVIITGGLAGDGKDFGHTWTLVDDRPQAGQLTAVGFYGDAIEVSHGSKGGWDAFGPTRTITKSTDNVLYELDGKPALEVYKRYLGDLAADLPASGLLFPLAVRRDADDPKSIVRTLLAVDEETQSLTFAGDLPTGYQAQLMKANLDKLIDGAEDAALFASEDINDQVDHPGVLIATSCVGRRLVLGARSDEEVEATMAQIPVPTHQLGFYSYGEISPWERSASDLHNQTMTLTWIREH